MLVLDNVNDLQDIRNNYKILNTLNNFHIILTSRINNISNIAYHKVEGLDLSSALNLFRTYYDKINDSENILLETIFNAVGYNTLVIELIAKNLRELNRFKSTYSINDLLTELQNFGILKIQTKSIETTYGSFELKKAKPEDVIRAMFDLTQLNDLETYLLCNISVLPPENINHNQFIELIDYKDDPLFDDTLLTLHQKGWFEHNEANQSFKCSPVVQAVIVDQNKHILFEKCKTLIQKLTNMLSQPAYNNMSNYVQFGVSIVNVFKSHSLTVAKLNVKLCDYYVYVGNLTQASKHINIALRMYNSLKDKLEIVQVTRKLGEIRQSQGNYNEAKILFKNASQHLKDVKQKDFIYSEEIALNQRSTMLYLAEGKTEEAKKILVSEIEKIKGLRKKYPKSLGLLDQLAQAYQNMGAAYYESGDKESSLACFREMRDCCVELVKLDNKSDIYKNSLAISFSRLGMVYRDNYDYDHAIEYFEQYYEISKYLYNKNPQSESFANNLARSYDFLGRMYLSDGYLHKAEPLLNEAYNLAKVIFANNPYSEYAKTGLALGNDRLGDFYMAKSNYSKANAYFNEYNRLSIKYYESNKKSFNYKNGVAISYYKLGWVCEEQGTLVEALSFYLKYNEYALSLVNDNPSSIQVKDHLAQSFARQGYIYHKMFDREKALFCFQEAEKIWSILCLQKQDVMSCSRLEELRYSIMNL